MFTTSNIRSVVGQFAAVWLLAVWAWAKEPPGLRRELDISRLPFWSQGLEIRSSVGYRDNVLQTSLRESGSLFWQNAIDWMAFPILTNRSEFLVLASFEDTRYFEVPEVDKEQFFLGLVQWKSGKGATWQCGLDAQYVYVNQMIDASLSENDVGMVHARGHEVALAPCLRWNARQDCWFEVEFEMSRQVFRAPLDDYWEYGPKLELGLSYARQSELSVSCSYLARPYLDRVAADRRGLPLAGTTLETQIHRVETTWRHHWDEARHWRTTTRLRGDWQSDNATGYHDYRRVTISEQLRWRCRPWEVQLQGRILAQEYGVQTVSVLDSSLRNRFIAVGEVHIEHLLGKKWKIYVDYAHESSLSNEFLDEYRINTVNAGLGVEF